MSTEPLEERYFSWLYSKVRPPKKKTAQYLELCAFMHRIEFDFSVPMDDNRAADGQQLRKEFMELHEDLNNFNQREWLGMEASVFEVLVALAERAEFMIDVPVDKWFEIFMVNLELHMFSDDVYSAEHIAEIQFIVTRFNSRTYEDNGRGGIFPLLEPGCDQRKVELWYQMAAYMTENNMY